MHQISLNSKMVSCIVRANTRHVAAIFVPFDFAYNFNWISRRCWIDRSIRCDIVTADVVEQLIGEIGKIKTQLNNTELQLYEANEKMAEIMESVCDH